MFKKEVKSIKELILRNLRVQGLETPLLQKRLIEAWPEVAGKSISRYTGSVSIRNQTLYVHLTNPEGRSLHATKRVCETIERLCRQSGDYRHKIQLIINLYITTSTAMS